MKQWTDCDISTLVHVAKDKVGEDRLIADVGAIMTPVTHGMS